MSPTIHDNYPIDPCRAIGLSLMTQLEKDVAETSLNMIATETYYCALQAVITQKKIKLFLHS